jgi:hypothetical protein
MREECADAGKYCVVKRHTKTLKAEHPDLSTVNYSSYIRCGFCDTVWEWKIFGKQIIYRNRNRNEHIPEIESSETQISPTEAKEVGVK